MLRLSLFALFLILFAAPGALASGLTATQTVERQVIREAPGGGDVVTWETAEKATPGDLLRYRMAFRNGGAAAADDVVLAVPVPDAVSYVENSATVNGTVVTFSVDGGKSFAPRGQLTITLDGETRPALSGDITHVRWAFPEGIAPGAEGELSFSAILK